MAKINVRGEKEATIKAEVVGEVVKTSNNSSSSSSSIKEKNSKKVFISIDNTLSDVLQYQEDGCEIFFMDDEETFLRLDNDEIQQLDNFTREKYRIARAVATQSLDLDSIKNAHKKFKPRESFASATNRLMIRGGKPDMHYSWKRPDELQQEVYEGGQICKDPEVETFGGVDDMGRTIKGGTTHTVGADGVDELILFEKPKESQIARREDIEMRSRRQNAAVETTAIAALDAMGGNASGVSKRP